MPSITEKFINRNCAFINQMYKPTWFVVHFTGGTPNLQSLYNYWQSSCVSSHYGIERTDNAYAKAGDIWQFVRTTDGSGANCCVEPGYAPFLPAGVNLNVRTITVECINPNSDNAGLCTGKQYESLVWLIRTVCQQLGIPTNIYTEYSNQYGVNFTFGNSSGGVIMHRDICPVNRQRCPGMDVYQQQMKQIMREVNGGTSMSTWQPPTRDKWIIDRWEAYGKSTDTTIPQRDTGIFSFWRTLQLDQNIDMGSPLGAEQTYDANWMVQYFEAGAIFWNRTRYEVHAMTGGGPR